MRSIGQSQNELDYLKKVVQFVEKGDRIAQLNKLPGKLNQQFSSFTMTAPNG